MGNVVDKRESRRRCQGSSALRQHEPPPLDQRINLYMLSSKIACETRSGLSHVERQLMQVALGLRYLVASLWENLHLGRSTLVHQRTAESSDVGDSSSGLVLLQQREKP